MFYTRAANILHFAITETLYNNQGVVRLILKIMRGKFSIIWEIFKVSLSDHGKIGFIFRELSADSGRVCSFDPTLLKYIFTRGCGFGFWLGQPF